MTSRHTADRQLERVLHILPAAARDAGASIAELAEALDVEPDTIRRDIREVATRSYYHPAGSADQLQIELSRDRVRIWTTGEFQRPVRLTPREAAAVALGLRVLARDAGPSGGPQSDGLLQRIEECLTTGPMPGELEESVEVVGAGADREGIRHEIIQAARDHRVCRIGYLKAHAPEPEIRRIHPLGVLQGQGTWYTVAWAEARDAIRVFRLDRVVEARVLDEAFQPPEAFDVEEFIAGRGVFQGHDALEVVVRYSPRIARWIRERHAGREERIREQPDGSLVVRHQVVDPVWIVNQVLQYGGEAVVVEPEEVRRLVRATAEGLAG